MSCDAIMDRVAASLTQSTEPDDSARAHLATCPTCAAEAAALGGLWDELGRLPAPPADTAGLSETIRLGRTLLAHTNHLPHTNSRARKPWVTASLLGVALCVGVLIGFGLQGIAGNTTPDGERASTYLFLLHNVAASPSLSEEVQTARIAEYRQWAEQLAEGGRLVSAQKLTEDAGRWLAPAAAPATRPDDLNVTGYFIVRAENYAEAVRLARSGPHLHHGGFIEIRTIETEQP